MKNYPLFTGSFILLVLTLKACNSIPKGKELSSAENILQKSIQFHDPEGLWGNLYLTMEFEELNSDSIVRQTFATWDQNSNYFKLNRRGTEIHGVKADSCFIEKGDVTCERVMRLRDYYTYLWGLPMKIPAERSWYMMSDSGRFLGTDRLINAVQH